MKTFLIVYGILALIFYILILILSTKDVVRTNRNFVKPVVHVSIIKLLFSSLLFPLMIIYAVTTSVIECRERGNKYGY